MSVKVVDRQHVNPLANFDLDGSYPADLERKKKEKEKEKKKDP